MNAHSRFTLLPLTLLVALVLGACGQGDAPAPAADVPPAEVVPNLPQDTQAQAEDMLTASPEAPPAEPVDAEPVTGTISLSVVPGESTAQYAVDEEFLAGALERLGRQAGPVITVGQTSNVSGDLAVDMSGAAPAIVSGQLIVDISTLTSDAQNRDRRIREEWLESSVYPQAVFVPREITGYPENHPQGAPATFELSGDLTIRETTLPTTFQVTSQFDGARLTGTAVTTFLMSSFGVEPPSMLNLFTVGDQVTVTVTLVMERQN